MRTSDQFIDSLLSLRFIDPEHDIGELCKIWQQATKCEWVWLWIKNEFNGQFELRRHQSASNRIYKPFSKGASSSFSVAQFSADHDEIVELYKEDFSGWEKHSGCGTRRYKCISHESLKEHKCEKFICIPIGLRKTNKVNASGFNLSASICIHYLNKSEVSLSHADLRRLGQLSSFFIENSYRSRNETTLQRLYRIDSEFAHAERKNSKTILNEYCLRLLGQLCNIVKAEAASLFYDLDGWDESVKLVGSTHDILNWETKKMLRKREHKDVSYTKQEGYTGRTFASGRIMTSHAEDDLKRKPKFIESDNKKHFIGRTTVFIPLKLLTSISGKDVQQTVGVLRCVGKKKSPSDFWVDTFDQIDLEALQFFCEQITPVLLSLVSRVDREKSISIVKHDLIGPLAHIRHIADHLETTQTVSLVESVETIQKPDENRSGFYTTKRTYQMKIPFRDLMNIKNHAIVASNLVVQLDPEMTSLTRFAPTPTFLDHDVLARLKDVMKYDARETKNMSISFEGFEVIPQLKVDRDAIERVFFNLISNAIKYGDRDTKIMISAFESDTEYGVSVSNYGIGIGALEQKLIFEEGYRSVAATKSPAPGLGLGLYIARRAMQRHGGRLELTFKTDPTTFCMFFPKVLRVI
ncbi:MAG: sensor histidine kinase [Planctomycetota bacterium]|nr:sensor histidine kinase [Planctomycetota bacterium]